MCEWIVQITAGWFCEELMRTPEARKNQESRVNAVVEQGDRSVRCAAGGSLSRLWCSS